MYRFVFAVLFGVFGITNAQTTSGTNTALFPSGQNLGDCICDATKGLCDLNCCCDPDCTSDDRNAFTICIDQLLAKQLYNTTICLPRNQVFTTNTPYIIEVFQDLLCLTLNNYAALNYYQTPIYLTPTQITALANLAVPMNFADTKSLLYFQSTSYYRNNDPIWTLLSTNLIGYLALPNDLNGNCELNSPISYLNTKTTKCSFKNLVNKCDKTFSFLNYDKFIIANRVLLRNPNAINSCLAQNNNNATGLNFFTACTNFTLQFNPAKCKLSDNTPLTTCAVDVVLDSTGNNCNNLVKMVTYTIKYSNPAGIASIDTDIVFANSRTSDSFEQKFVVLFQSVNQLASTVYQYSGNPGYITGQPLVAGQLNSSLIVLNSNRDLWFTIPKQKIDGTCDSSSDTRASIKFGQNAATDCLLTRDITPMTPFDCDKLQKDILDVILGISSIRPTHVASFGNSNTTEPGKWNQINNPLPSSTNPKPGALNGACDSIVTNANLYVAYSLAGNIGNPQAMVLYVGYEWGTPTQVSAQCFGQTCTNTISVRITTKVTYVDVSKPPEYIESNIPRPNVKLPQSFFYPFVLNPSSSNMLTFNPFILILAIIIKSFF